MKTRHPPGPGLAPYASALRSSRLFRYDDCRFLDAGRIRMHGRKDRCLKNIPGSHPNPARIRDGSRLRRGALRSGQAGRTGRMPQGTNRGEREKSLPVPPLEQKPIAEAKRSIARSTNAPQAPQSASTDSRSKPSARSAPPFFTREDSKVLVRHLSLDIDPAPYAAKRRTVRLQPTVFK